VRTNKQRNKQTQLTKMLAEIYLKISASDKQTTVHCCNGSVGEVTV